MRDDFIGIAKEIMGTHQGAIEYVGLDQEQALMKLEGAAEMVYVGIDKNIVVTYLSDSDHLYDFGMRHRDYTSMYGAPKTAEESTRYYNCLFGEAHTLYLALCSLVQS